MADAFPDRVERAARVAALTDALRAIPPELAPVERARTIAIREQVYFGYELPLSRARGARRLWGKYEEDRPWTVAAAELVASGRAVKGEWQLNREHVFEAAKLVKELLERQRTPLETADLLDERLVTCTVLASEHAALNRVPHALTGWQRYEAAGIEVQPTLTGK